jgi:hypothetical protein
MSNATPSRLGQANLTGATDALFLKVFSGEVMSTFNAKTIMKEKTRIRNIKSGKSASFAAIGKTVAEYHTPGAEILGNSINHNETVITIDDLLISHSFISNIDEAKNHYEVRSEYSKQMGQALAQTYDRNLLSMTVKAARAGTAGIADQGDAESIQIGATPTTSTLISNIYLAAQKLDEKNAPAEDRCVIVSPAVYYALVQDDKMINRDFGSNGSYSEANVMRVAGMDIVMSNNLAVDHTAVSGGTLDFNSKYNVDASDCKAVIMHKDALGTVQLMDMATEAEYDIRRQGTLAVSKLAVGHGILRPELIIELQAV